MSKNKVLLAGNLLIGAGMAAIHTATANAAINPNLNSDTNEPVAAQHQLYQQPESSDTLDKFIQTEKTNTKTVERNSNIESNSTNVNIEDDRIKDFKQEKENKKSGNNEEVLTVKEKITKIIQDYDEAKKARREVIFSPVKEDSTEITSMKAATDEKVVEKVVDENKDTIKEMESVPVDEVRTNVYRNVYSSENNLNKETDIQSDEDNVISSRTVAETPYFLIRRTENSNSNTNDNKNDIVQADVYQPNSYGQNVYQNENKIQPIKQSQEFADEDLMITKSQTATNTDISRNDKVEINTDNDVVDLNTLAMLDRFNKPAPLWTQEVLSRLSDSGMLYPDDDVNLESLNRREGAILTARSYNIQRMKQREQHYSSANAGNQMSNQFSRHDIDMLMREFEPEIRALGYDIIDEVNNTNITYINQWDWKINGEIRYNFARNTGSPRYQWSDNRIRARIYAEKAISDNWRVHGMLESDKSNIFNDSDEAAVSDNNDGSIELSRIYLEGDYNWWNIPFNIELGKTYAYLAEGNVLDSDFEGVKVAANVKPGTIYSAGYGRVNDTEDMYYLEGIVQNKNYDYLGGFYRWDNYGNPANIYALGMNHYIGNYTLGGMYLKSNIEDGSGADSGYVLSARYGKNFSWVPHTYEFDLKYYNMAGNTYINHTMSGVGNYMNGFSGWGAMYYYTFTENLMFSLQYYDLKDKTSGEKGKTTWAELTWSF